MEVTVIIYESILHHFDPLHLNFSYLSKLKFDDIFARSTNVFVSCLSTFELTYIYFFVYYRMTLLTDLPTFNSNIEIQNNSLRRIKN